MTAPPPPPPRTWHTWHDLMMDERYLARFFNGYFSPGDRRALAQVGRQPYEQACSPGCIYTYSFSGTRTISPFILIKLARTSQYKNVFFLSLRVINIICI
jgi:hypothetical protein